MAFAKHLLDFFGLEWQVILKNNYCLIIGWGLEILVMANGKKWGISKGSKIESWPY